MLKTLAARVGKYRSVAIMTPIFTMLEALMEMLMPVMMAKIIDEGIVEDNGAFVCEAYGQKDGKNVMVDLHLCAPGIEEAYEKAKMSGEMYLTGQGAFLYTKLFVNEMITQKGLISSDMLDDDQVEQYLAWAAELGITYNIEIKEGVVCED